MNKRTLYILIAVIAVLSFTLGVIVATGESEKTPGIQTAAVESKPTEYKLDPPSKEVQAAARNAEVVAESAGMMSNILIHQVTLGTFPATSDSSLGKCEVLVDPSKVAAPVGSYINANPNVSDCEVYSVVGQTRREALVFSGDKILPEVNVDLILKRIVS